MQHSPSREILAGRIPNHKQAGVVSVSLGHVAAFDHVAAEFMGNKLKLSPADKTDVAHTGQILEEGLIALATDDGRVRIPGFVANILSNYWYFERMRGEHKVGKIVGNQAVYLTSTLELPEYEITDVDNHSGVLTAKPRYTTL